MINVLDLKAGDRLALRGNVVAAVVENMGDGQWVEVEYLQVPDDPGEVGNVELCHAQDIVKVLPSEP